MAQNPSTSEAGPQGAAQAGALAIAPEGLAWLAGLLEGEGSCVTIKREDGGYALRVQCAMTDEDVIRRAQAVAGVGKIFGPYAPRTNERQSLTKWGVQRRADVVALVQLLRPFMGERRKREIDRILQTDALHPIRTWTHGKETSYKRHGCRCEECCEAARTQARSRYARRKARGLPGRGSVEYNERRKARNRKPANPTKA